MLASVGVATAPPPVSIPRGPGVGSQEGSGREAASSLPHVSRVLSWFSFERHVGIKLTPFEAWAAGVGIQSP